VKYLWSARRWAADTNLTADAQPEKNAPAPKAEVQGAFSGSQTPEHESPKARELRDSQTLRLSNAQVSQAFALWLGSITFFFPCEESVLQKQQNSKPRDDREIMNATLFATTLQQHLVYIRTENRSERNAREEYMNTVCSL